MSSSKSCDDRSKRFEVNFVRKFVGWSIGSTLAKQQHHSYIFHATWQLAVGPISSRILDNEEASRQSQAFHCNSRLMNQHQKGGPQQRKCHSVSHCRLEMIPESSNNSQESLGVLNNPSHFQQDAQIADKSTAKQRYRTIDGACRRYFISLSLSLPNTETLLYLKYGYLSKPQVRERKPLLQLQPLVPHRNQHPS